MVSKTGVSNRQKKNYTIGMNTFQSTYFRIKYVRKWQIIMYLKHLKHENSIINHMNKLLCKKKKIQVITFNF